MIKSESIIKRLQENMEMNINKGFEHEPIPFPKPMPSSEKFIEGLNKATEQADLNKTEL